MPSDEIRKLLENENLIIGTERTLKALRKGELQKIWVVSNPNPTTQKDIEHYKKITGVEVETLKENNEELGILCKKQHSISVISLKK
ncbi:ribosomal L7Ae/L30e/S12e/Gadd45 family protein [Candidatus Woesearchaeota archaeon]|nr:ribosomal L7Ae/L30e/S12e/Gadd45 family protein [Candidatus Woesearchaeota archaeon]MCF8013655.1 ribosomal L7Ae/L30e/S12e/Gadd45 family protein [Candidatus Woesearchaeota archaeon]